MPTGDIVITCPLCGTDYYQVQGHRCEAPSLADRLYIRRFADNQLEAEERGELAYEAEMELEKLPNKHPAALVQIPEVAALLQWAKRAFSYVCKVCPEKSLSGACPGHCNIIIDGSAAIAPFEKSQ